MSEASITKDFEDISISQRDVKGYEFEVRVDKVLRNIGIEYTSNPLQNIALWKRHQGVGTDFKIPSLNWELEAKYSEAKIFPSWIERDYIPRFRVGSFRVTVYNETMKWTTSSLEKCFIHDIYLIEISYLKYVLKAEMKHRLKANKVLEPNSSKDIEIQNTKKQSTEKQKQKSEIEGLELISSKSSATFKDKFRTKLAKIGRFLGEIMNLLRSLWKDKSGSMTLTNWIPIKVKIKQKTKNKRKLFSCPFRIVLVCPHYGQFYSCLIQIIDDYATKLEKYGYSEEYIDKLIDMALLRHIWKYKDQILGRCKCKPISIIDDEITSRKSLNGIAVTEPCKRFRCSQLIKKDKCEWLELWSEYKVKPKQLKLVGFMNGDDQHGQT